MNNKILMIIGLVLIVVSIALSAISLVTLNNTLGKIQNAENVSTSVTDDRMMVPISEQMKHEMGDAIIAVITNEVDGKIEGTLNISVTIGFSIYTVNDKDEKDEAAMAEVDTMLTENEGYLRDRISKLIAAKDYEYLTQTGIEELLQEEILEMVSYELDTDAITQVYFPNGLLTSYR